MFRVCGLGVSPDLVLACINYEIIILSIGDINPAVISSCF